jgi:hypothetical protein
MPTTERKPHFVITLWLVTEAKTKTEAVDIGRDVAAHLRGWLPGYETVDWDVEDREEDQ